jgi:hypothetical protein
MKEKRIKGLEIVPPKAAAFKYETAPDLPRLHQNCIFVGARGSGKGVAMANLCRIY